uniref:RAB34, member RAS oncogene family b n=1 Tax=Sphaeramia orbicularis TaxID=375764 RepID=A0A673BU14_9TELE
LDFAFVLHHFLHLPFFSQCFSPNAALHTKDGFHPQVKAVCRVPKGGTVSFNIAKVIVVGDVAVGKTCLISRFCKGEFDKNYKATIGVDFEMERFEVLGVPFSLQLWDTAGQERFKCIASTYYRGAQAIIVVFDLSSVGSLAHARPCNLTSNSGRRCLFLCSVSDIFD